MIREALALPRVGSDANENNSLDCGLGKNPSIENKGASSSFPKPFRQKETAAPVGSRRGGKLDNDVAARIGYATSREDAILFALAAFSSPAGLLPQVAAARERDRCARLRLNLPQIDWEAASE